MNCRGNQCFSLSGSGISQFSKGRISPTLGLNVIVGANGTGKTHLLKLPYAVMAMGAEEGRKRSASPTKILFQNPINIQPLEVEPLKAR